MWSRTIEEKMELVRKRMEDMAMVLGLGHPKVYQLSRELDQLHNQFERERKYRQEQSTERVYCRLNSKPMEIKERSYAQFYRVVV